MGWFNRQVERGVTSALTDYFKPGGKGQSAIQDIVWKTMDSELSYTAQLSETGFLWALRLVFHKHGLSYEEAAALALTTLREFLSDERVRFGDKGYGWTRAAAAEIADEYEFQHWERVA